MWAYILVCGGGPLEATVIYADILFFINFITDGICLAITALILGRRFVTVRFVCGCVLGGLYAPAALAVGERLPYVAVLVHLAAACLICFTALPATGFKEWAVNTLCFFTTCGVLGGCLCGVYSLCGAFAMYRGAFYAELSPVALIASVVLVGAFLVFCISRAKGRAGALHCDIQLERSGELCKLFCLIDSGNLMCCPYTALPVVIVRSEALRGLFTKEALETLKEMPAGDGIRPIPVRGVGGSTMLPSFVAEKALVRPFGKKEYKEKRLCIAIDFSKNSYGGCDGAAPGAIF